RKTRRVSLLVTNPRSARASRAGTMSRITCRALGRKPSRKDALPSRSNPQYQDERSRVLPIWGDTSMKRLLGLLAILVMVGVAILTRGSDPAPLPEAASVLPLALGTIHPRISPDGQTIAVSYQGAIWTVPAEGGTLTRLSDGAGFDHDPAW